MTIANNKLVAVILLCSLLIISSIGSANSSNNKTEKDTTNIHGIAIYADGIDAGGAAVTLSSNYYGELYTMVEDEGQWSISCNWPVGSNFQLKMIGCCSHKGWRVIQNFTIQEYETDTGTLILNPNIPPEKPSMPSGPETSRVGERKTYTTSTSEPEGDEVKYRLSVDGGGAYYTTDWTTLDQPNILKEIQVTFQAPGEFAIKAQAMDRYYLTSEWSNALIVEASGTNSPPILDPINGPSFLENYTTGTFSIRADDPEGSKIRYRFDWNDGNITEWSGYAGSGEPWSQEHSWNESGTYYIKAQCIDRYGSTSGWGQPFTVIVGGTNNPPETPTIFGEESGLINTPLEFFILGNDSDDVSLDFYVDWGDDSNTGWIGPYTVGTNICLFHNFESSGTYHLKVKSKDNADSETNWSTPHTVEIYNGPSVNISEAQLEEKAVSFLITNDGDQNSEQISWSININGGFFFGNRSSTGTFETIIKNESKSIVTTPLFGFGKLLIKSTIEGENCVETSSTIPVFLLFDRFFEMP